MDVKAAIEARRSVKKYDAGHRMSEGEIKELMRLAMLSPTAFNIQHWRFVLVQEPALRRAIRDVSWGQAQITDASLFIVVCADLRAWEKEPGRYWANAQPEVRDAIVTMMSDYYRGRPEVQRDEAMRSCGIAAQTVMLAAKAMGYDSCAMDLSDFGEVAKLISLPEDHAIAMFVAIGKAAQEANPRGGQLGWNEIVRIDRF